MHALCTWKGALIISLFVVGVCFSGKLGREDQRKLGDTGKRSSQRGQLVLADSCSIGSRRVGREDFMVSFPGFLLESG